MTFAKSVGQRLCLGVVALTGLLGLAGCSTQSAGQIPGDASTDVLITHADVRTPTDSPAPTCTGG